MTRRRRETAAEKAAKAKEKKKVNKTKKVKDTLPLVHIKR